MSGAINVSAKRCALRPRALSLSRAIPKHFGLLSGNKHANKNVCIVICDLVMVLHGDALADLFKWTPRLFLRRADRCPLACVLIGGILGGHMGVGRAALQDNVLCRRVWRK